MPKGELSCRCALPGSRIVVRVYDHAQYVGGLCEACAWDDHMVERFFVAAGWLYGWRRLNFEFIRRAEDGPLRRRLESLLLVLDESDSDSVDGRRDRRVVWEHRWRA